MVRDIVPEFNLLDESWIVVRTVNGLRKEVSLLELFRYSSEYQSLAGEMPSQDAAVLRLLLAILHGALGGRDIDGEPFPYDDEGQIDGALELWKSLWRNGLPYARIEAYLKEYKDRFYLFHPTTPFYQLAELDERDDAFGSFSTAKLIGDLLEGDNKKRLFATRSGIGKDTLNYSEAARWLLTFVSYAETFGKLEAKGRTSKDDPSVGVGWLGKLGLVIAIGDNLFETLMLNLTLLYSNGTPWGDDKPFWEKPVSKAERNVVALPNSQAGILTLQSRRALLERSNNIVTGFRFVSGDIFPSEEAFSEMMTIWRYTKQPGERIEHYRPRTFQPAVQVWRDFSSLVVQSRADGRRIPGVIWWLKYLVESGYIPSSYLFRIQTIGIAYGTMQAVTTDVFSDSISFNAGLLSELNSFWVKNIVDELSTTDKLVKEVGSLAQNIAKASGVKDGKADWAHGANARDDAKTTAYYVLDPYFRSWLESIDPTVDNIDMRIDEWWGTSQKLIRALGSELISNCSPQALIGRSNQSALDSYSWFISNTRNREALKKAGEKKHGKAAGNDQ